MKCVHLTISGRVQGVSYRYYAQKAARDLGLSGWVRNLPDGDVEALAQGDDDAISRFIRWCHAGSPAAHVEQVQVVEEPTESDLSGFHIRY